MHKSLREIYYSLAFIHPPHKQFIITLHLNYKFLTWVGNKYILLDILQKHGCQDWGQQLFERSCFIFSFVPFNIVPFKHWQGASLKMNQWISKECCSQKRLQALLQRKWICTREWERGSWRNPDPNMSWSQYCIITCQNLCYQIATLCTEAESFQ